MASTVGRCINLLECSIVTIGKLHQRLEGASNVRIETDASLGLETDLCGFKSGLLTPCWWVFVRSQWGHVCLSRLIYLLSAVCAIYRRWSLAACNNGARHYGAHHNGAFLKNKHIMGHCTEMAHSINFSIKWHNGALVWVNDIMAHCLV